MVSARGRQTRANSRRNLGDQGGAVTIVARHAHDIVHLNHAIARASGNSAPIKIHLGIMLQEVAEPGGKETRIVCRAFARIVADTQPVITRSQQRKRSKMERTIMSACPVSMVATAAILIDQKEAEALHDRSERTPRLKAL